MLAAGAAPLVTALAPSPKLLVLVLLEQLRGDHLDAVSGQFGANGLRKHLVKRSTFPRLPSPGEHLFELPRSPPWPPAPGPPSTASSPTNWYDAAAHAPVAASSEVLLGGHHVCAQVAADPTCRTFVIGMDAAQTALFAGDAPRPAVLDGFRRPLHHPRRSPALAGGRQQPEARGERSQRTLDGHRCSPRRAAPAHPALRCRAHPEEFLPALPRLAARPSRRSSNCSATSSRTRAWGSATPSISSA